jgi:hypothetical protein
MQLWHVSACAGGAMPGTAPQVSSHASSHDLAKHAASCEAAAVSPDRTLTVQSMRHAASLRQALKHVASFVHPGSFAQASASAQH